MPSEAHDQAFLLAGTHVDEGRLDEALVVLTQLLDTDLDDFGKAMACVNAAIVHDKAGRVEQALEWYERGIRLERSLDRYFVALHKTSYCVDKERHADALAAITALVASGISELDKANLCLSAAGVCEKLGQGDATIGWYDRGIQYERHHCRYLVAEHKAAYLARQGRSEESLAIYDRLAREDSMTEADKDRIRHNVFVMRGTAR